MSATPLGTLARDEPQIRTARGIAFEGKTIDLQEGWAEMIILLNPSTPQSRTAKKTKKLTLKQLRNTGKPYSVLFPEEGEKYLIAKSIAADDSSQQHIHVLYDHASIWAPQVKNGKVGMEKCTPRQLPYNYRELINKQPTPKKAEITLRSVKHNGKEIVEFTLKNVLKNGNTLNVCMPVNAVQIMRQGVPIGIGRHNAKPVLVNELQEEFSHWDKDAIVGLQFTNGEFQLCPISLSSLPSEPVDLKSPGNNDSETSTEEAPPQPSSSDKVETEEVELPDLNLDLKPTESPQPSSSKSYGIPLALGLSLLAVGAILYRHRSGVQAGWNQLFQPRVDQAQAWLRQNYHNFINRA